MPDRTPSIQAETSDVDPTAGASRRREATTRKTGFRASSVALDITPDVEAQSVPLQGYAGPPRVARQKLTPLLLQLLLIEDAQRERCLIVAGDLFGFDRSIVQAVREALDAWGIGPESIVLNASHTHCAPGTVSNVPGVLGAYVPGYARAIAQAVAQVMPTLYDGLADARLRVAEARARIGVNRRSRRDGRVVFAPNPDGAYDDHTPVLRIDLQGRDRPVLVVSHACHPTGLNAAPVLAGGYPSWFREALLKRVGPASVLFLQGAAGSAKLAAADDPASFAKAPQDVVNQAQRLADAVADALEGEMTSVEGELSADLQTLQPELSTSRTDNELRAIASDPARDALTRSWAQGVLGLADRGRCDLEVQTLRIGEEVTMVTFPGEPVAELSLRIRREVPSASRAFILGYTNGLRAYLPTAEMVREGGYEADQAHQAYLLTGPFTEEIEPLLVQAVREQLPQPVARRKPAPARTATHPLGARSGEAFFCLSSGRCGTMTLAHALNTACNARVHHHPQPFLVPETKAAWEDRIDRREVFLQGRSQVIRRAWREGLVFGELDMNMTPFAVDIAELIPTARFLVLARNPWDFVRSGMRRGYYLGHPWDVGRLTPSPGSPIASRWDGLAPFEKVCWLWGETYRRIDEFVERIGPDRCLRIRFEDLLGEAEAYRPIFEFLGLSGFDGQAVGDVRRRKLNEQTGGEFPRPRDWSTRQKDTLWQYCCQQAASWGYTRDWHDQPTEPRGDDLPASPPSSRPSSQLIDISELRQVTR
jgi:hypothetical protein